MKRKAVKLAILSWLLLPALLLPASLHASLSEPVDPCPSEAIYLFTQHYAFHAADSLIRLHESRLKHDPEFELAVINYYWTRKIAGNASANWVQKLNNAINSFKEHHVSADFAESDEHLFLITSVLAFGARVHLHNNAYFAALNDLKKYNTVLKKTFGREKTFPPFYLTSGLYYYFSAYATEKLPFVTVFSGEKTLENMKKGIAFLKIAAGSDNRMVNTEARYFLMKIYADLQNNPQEAARYCQLLINDFPENLLYRYYMVCINLALNQEQRAAALIVQLSELARDNESLTPAEREHYIKLAADEMKRYKKSKS
jgi:hypothetical protein